MKVFTPLLLGLLLILLSSSSYATTIDFESETSGSKANGYVTDDSNLVTFTDSFGADLGVFNFGNQGDGLSLAVNTDSDGSWLVMDFLVDVNYLSLDFGNDDSGFSNAGDLAVLTLFNGAAQVGQVSEAMNRNDIMDQTILFSGLTFNKATFFYDVTSQNGLIEIVDNITFEEAAPVPEPATMLLFGLGILGLAGVSRKKKITV